MKLAVGNWQLAGSPPRLPDTDRGPEEEMKGEARKDGNRETAGLYCIQVHRICICFPEPMRLLC